MYTLYMIFITLTYNMFFYLFQKSTDDQGAGSSVAPPEYGENLPAQEGVAVEQPTVDVAEEATGEVSSGIRHVLQKVNFVHTLHHFHHSHL